jgi:hypothetical protein
MTAVERVQRTQRALRFVVAGSVLFWAGAALFGGLVIVGAVSGLLAPSATVGSVLPMLAIVGGVATLGVLTWRGRFAWSFQHVALWIEERAPELRYTLLTAVDPRYRDSLGPMLDPIVSRADTTRYVRTAATRTTLPAFAAFVATLALFLLLPSSWKEHLGTDVIFHPGGSAAAAPVGNRLVPLTGRLAPPAYAQRRTETLDEPSTISGLQGSRVMLTGKGAPDGVHVTLGDKDIPVTSGERGWTSSFTMSDSLPAALKLMDRQYSRLVVVNPSVDQSPSARLMLPVRDTTLRVIAGSLHLSAAFADDVGLATAEFEFIVSNMGEGDNTEARAGTLAKRALDGKSGSFVLDVPYASLNLKEGDLLSVRAVVTDNNTLYGPGKGYSETRSIRVARKGEYDSLSVTAAPPSADTAMMTLRMLIIATEALEKQRPTMEKTMFVDSATALGGKAEAVRQKIQRIISEQTGFGEVAANPLLVEALDAMWEATRSLAIADTRSAIPQMWIAYKALEKLRNEKRYYLRGRLPQVVVNIDRVRLTGTDTGVAKRIATERTLAGTDIDRLRGQYTEAVRTLKTNPEHAVELFTLLRVATLRTKPAIAAALGDAVTAIQRGTDATLPLLRARQALDGLGAGAIDSLPAWTGSW